MNKLPAEGSNTKSVQRAVWLFRFFILLVLGSGLNTTWAQYRFDTYTTDNGLPQNGVREITQTPDGYRSLTAVTNPFGYFVFGDVEAGRVYTISVSAKRFRFSPLVLTVDDGIDDLEIRAN